MAGGRVKFGLTLPNRGVVIGVTTVAEMLQLAADAESSGWDSVWVGDSIFAKPRLDAMVLMGAIAARTTRVRIGPACFASTPLRNALVLAYQWASLDFLSGGRTVFVACQGQPGAGVVIAAAPICGHHRGPQLGGYPVSVKAEPIEET
jgi:alkanesulfonate monooxygenase SsuD/methylene tetrahydromethanopterin reductase-like flavin-dependent oxidoreductase (luciferase family)